MNIIDNLNKHYTESEDFEVGDWFYDEIGRKHFHIVENMDEDEYMLYQVEADTVWGACSDIELLIESNIADTSRLVKIPKDKVHIVFGDMPHKED